MANNLYRGTDGIEYVSHGAWNDPELIYDGKSFNYWDIDNALWDMFCEEITKDAGISVNEMDPLFCEDAFNEYVQNNAADFLNDCICGGYDYKIVED